MDIVVCIKQVPETLQVGLDRDTGYARRSEAKGVVNLADRHALEVALALKAAAGGKVVVLSMGPPGTDQALRQALAAGADEAVLVSDAALAGSDTGVTAAVLAAALRQLSDVGLVLTGEASADGATSQLAPRLAEALGQPLVTAIFEASLAGETLRAGRNAETCREQVEVALPAVVSVSLDAPKPRIPNAMGVMKAAKKPLASWTLDTLGLSAEAVGQAGSTTVVTRAYKPEKRDKGERLTGATDVVVQGLLERLSRKNLLEV
ncbi:MAG: electron transfer flavoprotein subunit beta/FixA family protein [Candidatus Sericytochromatia bacterium]|nr:electron transfer flavoprotein subunit beta/FixA family protein [Candidatus Sericytochromatia bacterium]